MAGDASINGVTLLDGSTTSLSIQVGIDSGDTITVGLADTTATALGITGLAVTDTTLASASLTIIDAAVNSVSTNRGALGATQNRLNSVVASISNTRENLSAAESRIRDVDVAYETADLMRNSIMQQAAVSVLAQANIQPQLALSMLG